MLAGMTPGPLPRTPQGFSNASQIGRVVNSVGWRVWMVKGGWVEFRC